MTAMRETTELPLTEEPSAPGGSSESPAPEQAFSFDELLRSLLLADDPMAVLKELVNDVNYRRAKDEATVLPVERFLMLRLLEADLFDEEELPPVQVVLLGHSHLLYLRCASESLAYGSFLRILRIEATLNELCFAFEHLPDLASASKQDLFRLSQRVINSICAQAPTVDTADWSYLAMPWQSSWGPTQRGEWAVRHAISDAIESVRLPFRLTARFRSNVAQGDVALEFDATPAAAFARSACVGDLGIVPTTHDMRRREASRYAARVGLLLAAHAFAASDRVRRVWVSAVSDTPARHECWYSVCLDRRAFSHVRLAALADPVAALRSLGASLNLDGDALLPTTPLFYLEDERFCPPMRHDLWQLSERTLPPAATLALGTHRVSGLVIHEELPRTLAAERVVRSLFEQGDDLGTSAERSVRAVLDAARATSDLTVWSAAERMASKIVAGTLELADPEAVRDELVEGDELTKSVNRAQRLLTGQRPSEALSLLRQTLKPLEEHGRYADTSAIAYRCFDSFAERVLHNRLFARDHRTVALVPDVYLLAHLMASSLHQVLPAEQGGDLRLAIAHARRAVEVAPLNAPAHLGLASCLQDAGDLAAAEDQLRAYLRCAFHPQGIALAYARMATLRAEADDARTTQACYQRCVRVVPGFLPYVLAQCQALMLQGLRFAEEMGPDAVDAALESLDIPLAPTEQISYYLMAGACAAIDAEVFPVARDLMRTVEALTGDDVMRGIRNSLELEPDV